jgi:hypothetical protein
MFSTGSTPGSSDLIARAIVFLSLCPAFPLPARSVETLVDGAESTVRGPGWYDSSWELSCGLDIAEVPSLDDWIGDCQGDAPLSAHP